MLDGGISVPPQYLVVESERLVTRVAGYSCLRLFPGCLYGDVLSVLGHFGRSREKQMRDCAPESTASVPRHEHTNPTLRSPGRRGNNIVTPWASEEGPSDREAPILRIEHDLREPSTHATTQQQSGITHGSTTGSASSDFQRYWA